MSHKQAKRLRRQLREITPNGVESHHLVAVKGPKVDSGTSAVHRSGTLRRVYQDRKRHNQ